MASNTVDKIFIEVVLNAIGFKKESDEIEKKTEKLEKGLEKTEKQSGKTSKSIADFTTGLGKAVKGVAGFASVIAAGTGLLKLADEARKANDELNFLSKNLGMSSQEVKAFQGAAAAMGGSAKGMASDMQNLNLSMNDFAMTGESSMLPMFNTLGVSMVDAQGKVRGTNDVMLDLADSMSKMDRQQGFLMGKKMGFDEGTINTLLQGRDAMQKMVDYHKQMYSSSKEELEASRKLSENQAKLGAHWESMKLMMANAIIPLLVELSDVALKFFEFLQRHQKTVKVVFEGMAIFLGMLVIPLLGKALVAALAFIAPFAPFILVVGALAAAFVLLYDDYKVWAEGGKSLFDWGAFRDYIDKSTLSTDNLRNAFKNLTRDMLSNTIPTLKGYADIVKELSQGNFKVAGSMAKDMMANLGRNIGDKIDNLTGNKEGSFIDSASHVFEGGGSKKTSGGYVAPRPKSKDIVKVLEVGAGYNIVQLADGTIVKRTGSWNWRNNNSGNIEGRGGFSKSFGAVDLGGASGGSHEKRFAIFPNYEAGKRAKMHLLFESDRAKALSTRADYGRGLGYKDKTLKQAVAAWAPPEDHNDTAAYQRKLLAAVGGRNKRMSQYTMQEREAILRAMQQQEGYREGKEVVIPYNRLPERLKSKAGIARNSISQGASQAQHAMPKTGVPASTRNSPNGGNTHNVDVKVQNINVNTTASTVTGTMNDAGNALKNGMIMYQYPIGIPT